MLATLPRLVHLHLATAGPPAQLQALGCLTQLRTLAVDYGSCGGGDSEGGGAAALPPALHAALRRQLRPGCKVQIWEQLAGRAPGGARCCNAAWAAAPAHAHHHAQAEGGMGKGLWARLRRAVRARRPQPRHWAVAAAGLVAVVTVAAAVGAGAGAGRAGVGAGFRQRLAWQYRQVPSSMVMAGALWYVILSKV